MIRRKATSAKATDEADVRDGGVQSVDRALSIIEVLAEDDEGYRLTDLAVRTGLSTSTVHRLLATLEKRRFVQFDRTESKWHVGAQSFAVGATFTRRRNFTAQAMHGRGRQPRPNGKIGQPVTFVVFGQHFDNRQCAIDRLHAAIPRVGIVVGAGFRFGGFAPDHGPLHRDLHPSVGWINTPYPWPRGSIGDA